MAQRGTCGCCERRIRVRKGLIAYHGYQRPGDGVIYDSCFGARKPPHELSPEVAKEYRAKLLAERDRLKESLSRADSKTELLIRDPLSGPPRMIFIDPTSPYWKSSLGVHQNDLKYRLANTEYNVSRMDHLLKDWTEKPLEEC
jgi:hypothetical protein